MAARTQIRFAGSALAIFMLAQVPIAAYLLDGGPGSKKMLLIAICAITVLVGHLSTPIRTRTAAHRILGPLLWAVLLGLIAYLTMALHEPRTLGSELSLRLAIGVGVLCFLLDRVSGFLSTMVSEPAALSATLLLLVAAGAGPLWIGPWAEILAAREYLPDAIIAASPLTYLAVLAEHDYLRSQWFYQNTPFGGLRYAYPNSLILSISYVLLSVLFWAGESLRRRR